MLWRRRAASAAARSVPRATNSSQVAVVPVRRAPARCGAARAVRSRSRSATRSVPRNSPIAISSGASVRARMSARLAGGVAGVQRDDDGARVVRGQAGDHPVPGIRRPDGDPVSGGDTEVDHRRGGPAHLVAQLGEGQCLLGRDQRVVVGKLHGRSGPAPQEWSAGRSSSMLLRNSIARLLFPPFRKLHGAQSSAGPPKQVLGRLAYRDGGGPEVPGGGPRVAGRQSGRRVRSAQGPRRAGP